MKWIKVQVPDDFDSGESMLHIVDGRAFAEGARGTPEYDRIGDPFRPTYQDVLDHGHVGLIDFMGSDTAIAEAARVSYAGGGTKKVSSDAGLIRYLLRHKHTTPFEMCEVKFHIKAPIFVFRQWHRHRTASINEMSARYSILDNEMYIPDREHAAAQATANKQGRDGLLSEEDYLAVGAAMEQLQNDAYETYRYLLGSEVKTVDGFEHTVRYNPPDAIQHRKLIMDESALNAIKKERDMRHARGEAWTPTEADIEARKRMFYEANALAVTTPEYPGLARELARAVLPVATYSQMYWKTNLWNLFNFLRLRQDAHAQYEIRVYADAMYNMIQPLFPQACAAYEDYIRHSMSFSKQDQMLLGAALNMAGSHAFVKDYGKKLGMSQREVDDFIAKLTMIRSMAHEDHEK